MATGFPVKNNYATGDVLTAANMNDLSGTLNYLQYMPPRNPVLNSNFSVWQRGTSVAVSASTTAYTADRYSAQAQASQALTVSRQATSDTTNLPNIQYCARVQRNSGQTGTGTIYFAQSLETLNSIAFSGKAVTVSFYARAGANYSATSSALPVYLWSGTGTDQNVNGGYTGANIVGSVTATLTTTWQRFTFTGTVPATATELALQAQFIPTGTASTNDYFEVTGIQLELGSVANTYMPNQPTYQGELAACMRYCQMYNSATANGTYYRFASGGCDSTTSIDAPFLMPVPMRITPSLTTTGTASNYALYSAGSVTACSAVPSVGVNSSNPNAISFSASVASGMTAGRAAAIMANNNNTAYLLLTAEL